MARDPYAFTGLEDTRTRGGTPAPPPVFGAPFTAAPGDMVRGPREFVPAPLPSDLMDRGTYPIYPYQQPVVPTTPAPVTPPGPAAFAGSPLNTLYGIDSESYLSDDQRKLARMIQGKFDSSLNRRDRELAQYGAPQLSSFVEDEALARAMSLARGLNIPVRDALGMVQGSGPASRGGGGSGGGGAGSGSARAPALTTPRSTAGSLRNPSNVGSKVVPPTASPSQAAKWQQIMSGLTSIMPLLLGKEGMNGIMNQGLIKWVGDKFSETFGTALDPRAADMIIREGVAPSDEVLTFNPITGMPMGVDPDISTYSNVYGPGSGWSEDVIGGTPGIAGGTWADAGPGSEPGWGGGVDWTVPGGEWGGGDWWSGGDTGSWWGDVYEPAGGFADWADPYGIGGW